MIVMDLRDALQAQMNSTIMLMRASGYSEQDILDCTSQARAALADDLRAPSPSANDMHGCTCEACQAMDRQLGSDTSSVAGTEREALEAALKTIVCSFHRNACYPDAMDGEVDFVVQSILSTVEGAALRRTVAETGELVDCNAELLGRCNRWLDHFGYPMGNGHANPDNDMIYLLRDVISALGGKA